MLQNLPIILFSISLIFAYYARFYATPQVIMLPITYIFIINIKLTLSFAYKTLFTSIVTASSLNLPFKTRFNQTILIIFSGA